MIIYNGKTTEAEYKEIGKLDGVYNGVISAVHLKESTESDNLIYNCVIYIPEVYGRYSIGCKYPDVDINFKQDADDEGHIPQIGELVKVSFDDGDSNSCRLVYTVPVKDSVRVRNANYIENGVLPTTILDIDDPKVTKTVLDWLNEIYFVTLGKNKTDISVSDFNTLNYLIFNTGGNKSYFLNPLMIPSVTSIGQEDVESSPVGIGAIYFLSNIYVLSDIIKKFENTQREKLIDIYDAMNKSNIYPAIDESYIKNIENKQDLKVYYIACLLSTVPPYYVDMLFPGIDSNIRTVIMDYSNNYSKPIEISLWWSYYNETSIYADTDYYIGNLFIDNIDTVENEWVKSSVSWLTGINAILPDSNKGNILLKKAIVFCFTLFPWIVYPLLSYELSSTNIFDNATAQYIRSHYNVDDKLYLYLFDSDTEYKRITKKISDLLRQDNLTPFNFVYEFKNIVRSLCTVESWQQNNMDVKFGRILKLYN